MFFTVLRFGFLMFLVFLFGAFNPARAVASDEFMADLSNSRQINVLADNIAIYLDKIDPAREDRVVAMYPYTRLAGENNYELDPGRTRFHFKYVQGGQDLVVDGKSFPVNVLALPQPPRHDFDFR